MMSIRPAHVLLACVLFSVGACSSKPAEPVAAPTAAADLPTAPPPEATPTLEALAPAELYVAKEPVRYRSGDDVEGVEVFGGETISATVGLGASVGTNGVAMLRWPGFFTGELLTGAEVALEAFDAAARSVTLDQTSGLARYTLKKQAFPVGKAVVRYGPVSVAMTPTGSDIIVSRIGDGEDGRLWVIAVSGSVELSGTDGVEAGNATLAEGQVVAYTPGEGFSRVMSVDPVAVEVWYTAQAAGSDARPITVVAFRCEVIADPSAELMPEPRLVRGGALGQVRMGILVDAIERDAKGLWVRVVAPQGLAEGAIDTWVAAEALDCVFPVADLAVVANVVAKGATGTATGGTPALAGGAGAGTGTGTPVSPAAQVGQDQGRGGGDGSTGGKPAPTQVAGGGGEPTVTECVGTECATINEPTETPRPRRTRPPTEPPKPTSEPATEPPPPATEPPAPATDPPAAPTEPPPAETP